MNKLFTKISNKEKGFTLIELMVVVGIIGILVAIAAPNFARYQAKARQSEAKIALSAVYAGEKSFYSEYTGYVAGMTPIGYEPEGSKRFYNVGWSSMTSTTNMQLLGYFGNAGIEGNTGIAYYTCQNNSGYACNGGTLSAVPGTNYNSTNFSVVAQGVIRASGTNDMWTINQDKAMQNISSGF